MRWTYPLLIVSLFVGCSGDEMEQASTQETAPTTQSNGSDSAVVQASATEAADGQATTSNGVPVVTAEQVLERVDVLIKERQFNQAISILNQLIAQKNDVPEAYLKRAAIYAEAKLYSRAVADMTSAIELLPRNARLRNTRGYFYLSQNDLDRAMADFDDAIGLDLDYHQPYNNRGLVRIAREDFEGSLLDFDAALRIDPEYLDALNNRGFALMRLERFDEAIENFSSVIAKSDTYVNAWNNRGLALVGLERHEEAIADFTKAIELQPGNLKYYLHRSSAYEALGRTAEAQADQFTVSWFRKLAELNNEIGRDQHNAISWVTRGRHLVLVERFDDAISDFNRALVEDAKCSDAHVALAEMWRTRGDVEQAIAETEKAIACNPLHPSHAAYSLRGDIHFEQGNFEAAIADYEAAQRFDSQVAAAYRSRSEQHQEAGDVEQASALLERATQIETSIHATAAPAETPAETSDAAEAQPEQTESLEQSAEAPVEETVTE